jgi:hypothetical protein
MRPIDATVPPDPEVIRYMAREILARPDYRLKPLSDDDFALLRSLWNALKRIFGPLFRLFETLYDISPLLAFGYVVALLLIAAALIWHIIYTFRTALRGRAESHRYVGDADRGFDPAELEDRARRAAERQDYITAVRYLFQACLVRLEQAERRALRKGATNHEYLRRFQGAPAYEPLRRFVDIIDCKWYGQGRCELSDFDECRRAHAEILLQQGA